MRNEKLNQILGTRGAISFSVNAERSISAQQVRVKLTSTLFILQTINRQLILRNANLKFVWPWRKIFASILQTLSAMSEIFAKLSVVWNEIY